MRNIKLQYYLRGLGVGILVTALIMGVALSGEEQALTDAQIREKAIALGMVDGDSLVLSDLQGKELAKNDTADPLPIETQDTAISEEAKEPEAELEFDDISEENMPEELVSEDTVVESIISEEDTSEQPAEETVNNAEESFQPKVDGEVNAEGDTVTIEIRSGANSYSVSKILEENGLVADAKAYDNYLCNGGYSKRIHTGKYLIAIGTSEEEIAKIITGNR